MGKKTGDQAEWFFSYAFLVSAINQEADYLMLKPIIDMGYVSHLTDAL